METRWIVAIVLAFALCHVTDAQLQTASNLTTNITRAGCGSTKLCVSNPTTCDPSSSSSCFFGSVQQNGDVLIVELSGSMSGYVAMGFNFTSQNPNSTIVFACGNNSGSVFFQTATKNQNESSLTPTNMSSVAGVQGAVKVNQTQCIFNVSATLNVTAWTSVTKFNSIAILTILSGSTNGTQLSNSTTEYESREAFNLSNPASNVPTTNTPITISRAGCGVNKLCMSQSDTCDPSKNPSSCFFTSVRKEGQSLIFELSGTTSGYVALGLKKAGTNAVFVCANNKNPSSGGFFFVTATNNGTNLVPANVSTVNSVQGLVNTTQNVVQCIFNTSTSFNVTTKADDLSYVLTLCNGNTTGTQLGLPSTVAESTNAVDLSKADNVTVNPVNVTVNPDNVTVNPVNVTVKPAATNSVTRPGTYVIAVLLSTMALHFM